MRIAVAGTFMLAGGALAGAAQAAPVNTAAPTIAGTMQFNGVVSCNPGSWSGDATGFSFQWLTGNMPVTTGVQGNGQTLRIVDPRVTAYRLQCAVTAVDATGGSTTARSAVGAVNPGAVTVRIAQAKSLPKGRVRIRGTVGPRLAIADGGHTNASVVVRQQIGKGRFRQLSLPVAVKARGQFTVVASTASAGRKRIQVDFTVAANRANQWAPGRATRTVLFTRGGRDPFSVSVGG